MYNSAGITVTFGEAKAQPELPVWAEITLEHNDAQPMNAYFVRLDQAINLPFVHFVLNQFDFSTHMQPLLKTIELPHRRSSRDFKDQLAVMFHQALVINMQHYIGFTAPPNRAPEYRQGAGP